MPSPPKLTKMAKRARRCSPERSSASPSPSSSVVISASSGGDTDVDRLIDLPEPLRNQILNLLPLKYAIRTGVLNKQWRGLWNQRWPKRHAFNLVHTPNTNTLPFIITVDYLLRYCITNRRLDILRLVFYPGLEPLPQLKLWLDHATECGVELLLLDLTPPPPPRLPHPRRGRPRGNLPLPHLLFSSGGPALTDLAFRGLRLTTPKSHFKRFVSLETLTLDNVKITDTTLRRITGDLPLLRRLDIRRCPDLKRATILARNITTIVIVTCPKLSQLKVIAHTLRSLHFSSEILKNYAIYNVAALEDLYLSRGGPGISDLMQSNWVRALGPLSHVRVLTLCSISLQYIAVSGGRADGVFRVFESLKELQLLMVVMADTNLTDIFSFFHLCRCPRLEKLFIELPTHMHDASVEIFLAAAEVAPPENCLEHLKMIKINNFKGHNNEIRLTRFLVSTATHLETLVIVAPLQLIRDEHSPNIVNFSNMTRYLELQLSSMTRASANLQILVYGRDNNKFRPTHDAGYCNI